MPAFRRSAAPPGVVVDIWVVPRSSKPAVGPIENDRLRVAVSSPPVDGAANQAVRELLAKFFAIPKSQIRIARGETGRKKTLELAGDPEALLARLQALTAT